MSVDTHLKGKNLEPYRRVFVDDVKFLVAPSLERWATSAHVSVKNRVLWQAFKIEPNHKHLPT